MRHPLHPPHPRSRRHAAAARRRITTSSVGDARAALKRHFGAGVELAVDADDGFSCRLAWVDLAGMRLLGCTFSVGVALRGAPDAYVLALVRAGAARMIGADGATAAELRPGTSGILASPGRPLTLISEAGVDVLTLRIEPEVVAAQALALAGAAASRPVRFAPILRLDGPPGADLERLLGFLGDELTESHSLLSRPEVFANLASSLARVLLQGHPHGEHAPTEGAAGGDGGDAGDGVPPVVRAVEAYIDAHAADDICLADLVACTGIKARALEQLFRRHRDATPMGVVKARRFALVRRRLLDPSAGATITAIARSCGFTHMGRFSVEYRAQFGESPGETLRRTLAAAGESEQP